MFDIRAWLSYHFSRYQLYVDELVNYLNYLRLKRYKRKFTPIQYGLGIETYLPVEIQDSATIDLYTSVYKHQHIFNTIPGAAAEIQIQVIVWEVSHCYIKRHSDGSLQQHQHTRNYYMPHPYRRQRMIARQVPIVNSGNYEVHQGNHSKRNKRNL